MKHAITAIAAAAALLAGAVPASAAPPEDVSFVVTVTLAGDLTASTTSGTFTMTGAIVDSGSESGEGRFAGLGHLKTGEPNSLHSEMTLAGQDGTIELQLVGLYGQLPAPSATGEGRWIVIGGTGAYEDLHGEGSWTAVATFGAGGPPVVVFTATGQVH